MVYIVHINYTKFEFMNGSTAMTFAELAKASVIGDATVEIEIKAVQPVIDDITEALEEDEE